MPKATPPETKTGPANKLILLLRDADPKVRAKAAEKAAPPTSEAERQELVPELLRLLDDANPRVREAALRGLYGLESMPRNLIKRLHQVIISDSDRKVSRQAVITLASLGAAGLAEAFQYLELYPTEVGFMVAHPVLPAETEALAKHLPRLTELLRSSKADLKSAAISCLQGIAVYHQPAARELMAIAANPKSKAELRREAITALGTMRAIESIDLISQQLLQGARDGIAHCGQSILALVDMMPESTRAFLALLEQPVESLRIACLEALKTSLEISEPLAERIVQLSESPDQLVRQLAAAIVEALPPHLRRTGLSALLAQAKDPVWGTRREALRSLAEYARTHPDPVAEVVLAACRDEHAVVRVEAFHHLVEIGRKAQLALPILLDTIRDRHCYINEGVQRFGEPYRAFLRRDYQPPEERKNTSSEVPVFRNRAEQMEFLFYIDAPLRVTAMGTLAEIGIVDAKLRNEAINLLSEVLKDKNETPDARRVARHALRILKETAAKKMAAAKARRK